MNLFANRAPIVAAPNMNSNTYQIEMWEVNIVSRYFTYPHVPRRMGPITAIVVYKYGSVVGPKNENVLSVLRISDIGFWRKSLLVSPLDELRFFFDIV